MKKYLVEICGVEYPGCNSLIMNQKELFEFIENSKDGMDSNNQIILNTKFVVYEIGECVLDMS